MRFLDSNIKTFQDFVDGKYYICNLDDEETRTLESNISQLNNRIFSLHGGLSFYKQ